MTTNSDNRGNPWCTALGWVGGLLGGLVGLGWAGLQLRPAPFPPVAESPAPPETIPLIEGLPAPVARFYRYRYGERVPVIETAVISGRGSLRLFGLRLPARFRFVHDRGRNYRHYFELTFFGQPIMKANEYFVDGRERMELPMGVQENNPKLNQGGNLGLWAEIVQWLPAMLLTDSRVRWEAVDDTTAWLIVPFEQSQERFLARFAPHNGDLQFLESMRYQNGEGEKTLWINGAWFNEGSPWAVFDAEQVALNVPVQVDFDVKGP